MAFKRKTGADVFNPAALMGVALKSGVDNEEEQVKIAKRVTELWDKDPVHPSDKAYEKLKTEIMNCYSEKHRKLQKKREEERLKNEKEEVEVISYTTGKRRNPSTGNAGNIKRSGAEDMFGRR